MELKTKDWVSDIYWYSIIKNILLENTQLFTIEIWEKMKDQYGYSYTIDRVEKELLNLQRTGYAISVMKRGKQTWMYPTGEKLLALERKNTIDTMIINFITTFNRIPRELELFTKMNESVDRREISERLPLISKVTNSIDTVLKKICREESSRGKGGKKHSSLVEPKCDADGHDMFFYETILNDLNAAIEDIDILLIIKVIDARKNLLL